jgi:hypothetical protein
MFHFYETAAGQILTGDPTVFPRSPEIRWATLFPVDERGEYTRVSPVFPDASSAVQWLRSVMLYARELPWYSRISLPDFTTVPFDQIHEAGMGMMNNYGELAGSGGNICQ